MYKFDHKPTKKELQELENFHKENIIDYVRVWFEGTRGSRTYENTCPVIYEKEEFVDWMTIKHFWYVDFVNPEIGLTDGSFARENIIRTKHVQLMKH